MFSLILEHSAARQCLGQRREQCAGMPLWQLRFSAHAAPALLACRAPYAAAVFTVSANPDPPGADEQGRVALGDHHGGDGCPPQKSSGDGPCSGSAAPGWALAPAAALRSRRRLAHLAWNRMLASELALTCEDGSLHVADVAATGGPRIGLGYQGTSFPAALRVERVGAPAQAGGPGGTHRGRAVCEWAPHPRVLLATQGDAVGSVPRQCSEIAKCASICTPSQQMLHTCMSAARACHPPMNAATAAEVLPSLGICSLLQHYILSTFPMYPLARCGAAAIRLARPRLNECCCSRPPPASAGRCVHCTGCS